MDSVPTDRLKLAPHQAPGGLARRAALLAALAATLATAFPAPAAARREEKGEPEESPPSVAEKLRGLERRPGLLSLALDRRAGKVYLELDPPDDSGTVADLLYVESLRQGIGSNDIGLDRGQLGEARLVRLRRLGRKVLVEQRNLAYRADSDDADERRAAEESFATSVLWGGEVAALDPDGRALVDLEGFLLRDAHGVARTLKEREQGSFTLDAARSAPLPGDCLAFPDNVELEALLTFASDEPGPWVRSTVPAPGALTVVQHHSFVRLPDPGFRPRRFDPRAGANAQTYVDYAVGLGEPTRRQMATRFRDPANRPIVFYVDRGAPEPVRSALVEGAGWWADAFARAGLPGAFRVELLPQGAHPLDARYNVVQWVHRSTRGWSYGGGAIDPRSGEIVKGFVSLGSLRVRQDRLLFEGLAGTAKTGSGDPDDPIVLSLARIRQLAAHEVGHALGFGHNFAASVRGRASVMDYPAPLVEVGADGRLDFSRAYASGIGEWDVLAVRHLYGEPPAGTDETSFLESIVQEGLRRGFVFLSDAEARPPGAADPRANLWDNGDDAVADLERTLAVRAVALAAFGEDRVAAGRPLAELDETLAPVYFHHRYALEAAAKTIGGLESGTPLRGDGQAPTAVVDAARQRRAIAVVLRLLDPESLDLSDRVLALLVPRPYESPVHREMFANGTSPAFDALGAAATAADQVLEALLQPERLGRLVDFHRRDPALPGLEELAAALLDRLFPATPAPAARLAEIERVVQRLAVERLIQAAGDAAIRPAVRGRLETVVAEAQERLRRWPTPDAASRAHVRSSLAEIDRFFDRETAPASGSWSPAEPPPGSPIGSSPELGDGDAGGPEGE